MTQSNTTKVAIILALVATTTGIWLNSPLGWLVLIAGCGLAAIMAAKATDGE